MTGTRIRRTLTRELIASRPPSLWRYRELLPIDGEPRTGLESGCTPLLRADRLGAELGLRELWVKDDSVNHPTLSYKDRVVPVAASRAVELGFRVFGCASTGNLANSVAAHAARLGLACYVFIPRTLEPGKIRASTVLGSEVVAIDGTYDDVNRLCTQVGDRYGWGFRQHQSAQLLRGGSQDLRIRDRRAARMELPAPRRLAGRRRDAPAAHRARLRRAA